ncbi:MAG: 3-deoxy-7-phosphoheptulonate synthase [Flavobacteriia bacterium]|nr:3-deoxy-7-phosphoheptulonate synthase [Flavobacteriia bacterium]
MILHLNSNIKENEAHALAKETKAICFHDGQQFVFVTASSLKEVPAFLQDKISNFWVLPNDNQLASKIYMKESRTIDFGLFKIGGNTKNTVLIGGPCSVESESQIMESATFMSSLDLKMFRGGCYKPRTSPYSFQGLGLEGLKLLAKVREKFGMIVITEARDASHIDEIIEYTDVIQVGAKAMYDQGILRACAKTQKPVLIKRGFGTTLQEFVQAAEFVLSGGNPNVILCERGIRTFETGTRFTLDLCGVAWLKLHTNLPIILDPSHAMGYAYGVSDLSKACVAMGIDGLLIESHPNPKVALSDASQQLNHDEFKTLQSSLKLVAQSVGYQMI